MILMRYTILGNSVLFLILMGVVSSFTTGKDDDFGVKTIHNKDSYRYTEIHPHILLRKHLFIPFYYGFCFCSFKYLKDALG